MKSLLLVFCNSIVIAADALRAAAQMARRCQNISRSYPGRALGSKRTL
jgi:hypothetical protein